ncbi:MAG: peptide chain release factor N(5)-glutamine methyltransferase [Desulfovibrionaceae bacterium]|nr:peptide chain release factor N(5)-glutamine methyltransferase [Desulfovibrionaceae bacterium]
MPSTIRDTLLDAAKSFREAGVDSPRLSAELLLAKAMGVERLTLIAYPERRLSDAELAAFASLAERRAAGEPAAYILGEKEFFGRMFRVTRATLIPRPETELLVEAALEHPALTGLTHVRFADLGTGSGCIAATLCAERPGWAGLGIDLSDGALRTAAANAIRLGVRQRLSLIQADFTRPILKSGSLDLVISNPPYVSTPEYRGLSREIRDFEPASALIPGGLGAESPDGLEYEAAVIRCAAQALKPGGVLLIEHGWTQSEPLSLLLKNNSWKNIRYCKDLAQKDRYISAVRG